MTTVKAISTYPRFPSGFDLTRITPTAFTVERVAQLFSGSHQVNLTGLAKVEGLSVKMERHPHPHRDTLYYHSYLITHGTKGKEVGGSIDFLEDIRPGTEEVVFNGIYPNLPSGRGLGLTMFWLALTRGNIFAGREIEISTVNPNSREMAGRLPEFRPEVRAHWEDEHDSIYLTPPTLSKMQISALEWYWTYVLHCPAGQE